MNYRHKLRYTCIYYKWIGPQLNLGSGFVFVFLFFWVFFKFFASSYISDFRIEFRKLMVDLGVPFGFYSGDYFDRVVILLNSMSCVSMKALLELIVCDNLWHLQFVVCLLLFFLLLFLFCVCLRVCVCARVHLQECILCVCEYVWLFI